MTMPACDDCLRRTDLLATLAARLDIEWRRRSAPAGVLSLPEEALVALDHTGAAAARAAAFSARGARERIDAAGLRAVCRCGEAYPERLRELPDPPAVLHIAGDPAALADAAAVALVGARRGTPYGVEVARGLASKPKLLLLDEPAGGLNHEEVDELAGLIVRMRDDYGLTIVLVEHHMNLVMRVSESVHVLNFGRMIASGTPSEVRANPAVVEAYLGTGDGDDGAA